jgi:hypothetical protein
MRLLPLLLLACSAYGDTILENLPASSNGAASGMWAEAFTAPWTGPWNNLTFSLLDGTTPEAAGTAYIFSGSPYVTESTFATAGGEASTGISNGAYVFDPAFTLDNGANYVIFFTVPMTASVTPYPSTGVAFQGQPNGQYFDIGTESLGFILEGDPVTPASDPAATPEPPPLAIVTLGVVLLALSRYKVRKFRG